MVRGQRCKTAPVTQQAPVMMAPSPDTQSPPRGNKAVAYGEIMSELSRSKSRIFTVCYHIMNTWLFVGYHTQQSHSII